MTVHAILKAKGSHVETTSPETTVFSAAWELKIKNIGALVVVSAAGGILGMISERDLARGIGEHGTDLQALPVSRLMTPPVLTCTPHERVTAVMVRMTHHRVRHLPVIDGGRMVGIISIGDVVK